MGMGDLVAVGGPCDAQLANGSYGSREARVCVRLKMGCCDCFVMVVTDRGMRVCRTAIDAALRSVVCLRRPDDKTLAPLVLGHGPRLRWRCYNQFRGTRGGGCGILAAVAGVRCAPFDRCRFRGSLQVRAFFAATLSRSSFSATSIPHRSAHSLLHRSAILCHASPHHRHARAPFTAASDAIVEHTRAPCLRHFS